jgi:perosamine synthetase
MKNIKKLMEMRRTNARLYSKLLSDINGLVLPTEKKWAKPVYWMYAIVVDDSFGISRDNLMEKLKEKGIETRPFFIPMHEQPIFQKMGCSGGVYPIADYVSERGLYLPSSSSLTEKDIKFIVQTIKEIKKHSGR